MIVQVTVLCNVRYHAALCRLDHSAIHTTQLAIIFESKRSEDKPISKRFRLSAVLSVGIENIHPASVKSAFSFIEGHIFFLSSIWLIGFYESVSFDLAK